MYLAPGTVVERYVVESVLGRGGMAMVYSIKHTLLGTCHALKVPRLCDEETRRGLLQEGRLQAGLQSPFVLPVTDVVFVDDAPALVMPLVRGCTLEELLCVHQPSVSEAAALISAVARGLASAHEQGVVHRDLKPSNVLLDMDAGHVRVRVADFGLARLETETQADAVGRFIGTPRYAAPEQLLGAFDVDHRADLWSLGVMLYRLLCGQVPFDGEDLPDLMQQLDEGALGLEPVPLPWRALVGSLLCVDPSMRGPAASQLACVIEHFCRLDLLGKASGVAQTVVRLMRLRKTSSAGAQPDHGPNDPRAQDGCDLSIVGAATFSAAPPARLGLSVSVQSAGRALPSMPPAGSHG